ncbi:ATP-dependent chaperone ClpB, partial [Arthrospira platensis SPKY1]|nr:ATP-dependent chaperone ClpB [Arthrospira platensis SPKY1]
DRNREIQSIREEIDATRLAMERAERNYDLNEVAKLRHGKLPELERKLSEMESTETQADALLKEAVSQDEIAEIVAKWTGVPVTRLLEGEKEKLLRLEDVLHESVV